MVSAARPAGTARLRQAARWLQVLKVGKCWRCRWRLRTVAGATADGRNTLIDWHHRRDSADTHPPGYFHVEFARAAQRFRCRPVKGGASQFTGYYFRFFQKLSWALCTAAHHCSLLMSILT